MGIRFASLLMPALLLVGCGTVNRGVESVHQPVVERTDYTYDLVTAGDTLAPGEGDRLAGWMASLRVGYGDRIAIDGGDASGGVHEAIARQAARFGMLVSDEAPVSAGPLAPGTARVVVSRMRASVPNCPDWSRTSGTDPNANTWSNYGCAVNSNLAAMIARPEDLVRGQPGTRVSDPATSFKAIDTLRKAPTTGAGGLKSESTKGGN